MTVPTNGTAPRGVVYLVHFARPYRHARHDTGWTTDLDSRLAEHHAGRGARLLQVITQVGIEWRIARTCTCTRTCTCHAGTHARASPSARAAVRVAARSAAPNASTMSEYRVIVTDEVQPTLAGHDGTSYQSLPQPREHALALARVLVGVARLPDEHGPWRQPRPGGTRTVRIEPAP